MNWQALKESLFRNLRKYLTGAGLKKALVSYALTALGMTGPIGFIAKIVVPKLIQWGIFAAEDLVQVVQDDGIKKDYKDEMSKGKDADEQKKIDSQLDIINGPK